MFKQIVADMIGVNNTPTQPAPFDLEHHLLEKKLVTAQANTDAVIMEIKR